MDRLDLSEEKRADFILEKLKDMNLSEEHLDLIQGWLISSDSISDKDRLLGEIFNEMLNGGLHPSDRAYELLEDLHRRISSSQKPKASGMFRKVMFRAAAVFIPIAAIISSLFLFPDKTDNIPEDTPRKYVSISVTEGKHKEFILPDSSRVWINSPGSISYHEDFRQERLVRLEGEAYFDVKKINGVPFFVETENINVKVLGTEFFVKELAGTGKSFVTLISGNVEIVTGGGVSPLAPGNMLHFDHLTSDINISLIPDDYVDWRFGDLNFNRTAMSAILDRLAAFYMADIAYPPEIDLHTEISIKFEGTEPLDMVIPTLLSLADGFGYKINGKEVIIYKK